MYFYRFCIFIIAVIHVQAWYTTVIESGTTITITSTSSTTTTTTTTTSTISTTASAGVTPFPTTGCSELNYINFEAITNALGQNAIFTPTSCLSLCPSNSMYYSLTILNTGYYGCTCYNSKYVFIPITTDDNDCIVVDGYSYGIANLGYFRPPSTEYIYSIN